MAKAKNHTDMIDSETLGNIKDNSALAKPFFARYPTYISDGMWYVRQS